MPGDRIRIPEDATRVCIRTVFGRSHYATAEFARRAQEKYPDNRDGEVTFECGPVPVHVRKGSGGLPSWTLWSDGYLHSGGVDGGGEPQCFLATEPLLRHIRRATLPIELSLSVERPVVPPSDVWMRWIDATGLDSTSLQLVVDERPVGPDQTATRILELMAYTVHCADSTTDRIWVLREKVHLPDRFPRLIVRTTNRGGALSARTQIFTDEDAALAAFTALNNHRPPVVVVTEAAERLGTTPKALRRALARAAQQDNEPYSENVGRTRWFSPNVIEHWWQNRPGHGPGRGHVTAR
ncbi:hypothetical protein [Streptomyces sp. NPDC007088]|uniref:hypothetical protein n=1 Tax=Streptomyces sp. NPDC007088 TaxID=3364773 RepID=UPI0036754E75